MAETAAPEIKRGLEGVVVDTSAVSKVMPEINALVYRGYPVQDLADQCTFEEVAYLLWHDDLPNKAQLEQFTKQERSLRTLSPDLLKAIALFPKSAHPMAPAIPRIEPRRVVESASGEPAHAPAHARTNAHGTTGWTEARGGASADCASERGRSNAKPAPSARSAAIAQTTEYHRAPCPNAAGATVTAHA